MRLEEYKESIRKYRGHLKSMSEQLEVIHEFGTKNFIQFSLSSKAIGVQKMATIADSVSEADQDEFVVWMHEKKRYKAEIDIKLLELI